MNSATTVKFVASDAAGLPLKRKQVTQACDTCRRKKKRCIHAGEEEAERAAKRPGITSAISAPTVPASGRRARSLPQAPFAAHRSISPSDDGASHVAASGLVELSSQWVCDMNPESILIPAAAEHKAPGDGSPSRDQHDIGTWAASADRRATHRASMNSNGRSRRPSNEHNVPKQHTSGSKVAQEYEAARRRYLLEECLTTLPPEKDYRHLKKIFLQIIHPIFPVLEDSAIELDDDSTLAIVTKQLISLAAAPDPAAHAYLRLASSEPVLPFQAFHTRLKTSIISILRADMIPNRFDHIRALILLSLFYQPSTSADRGQAALFCAEAYTYVVSCGAHLKGFRGQPEDGDVTRLFCALWALDRLSAAMQSQPVLLHDIDVGRDMEASIAAQPPAFRLLLTVVKWLDRTIMLYRPRQPFEVIDIPPLERLIIECDALKLPTPLLATTEILYHATALLSCRQPSKLSTVLPHPSINPRRSLSADRIVWAVQNESFAAFPFVPYAVAMALSVAYRKLRWCSTPMFRKRGRLWFKEIVGILKDLEGVWFSAKVNARLGEAIIKEMGKTVEKVEKVVVGNEQDEEGARAGGSLSEPTTVADTGEVLDIARPKDDSNPSGDIASVDTIVGQPDVPSVQASIPPEANPLDWAAMDSTALDVDLFSYFDPSFDLGAFETALEANLDMGMPQNWVTWDGANLGDWTMANQNHSDFRQG